MNYTSLSARINHPVLRRPVSTSRISYRFLTTNIGRALVASHATEVCFLQFADDDTTLITALTQAFPHHILEPCRNSEILASIVHQLVRGEPATEQLSLHTCGTKFQEKVWAAIRSIPSGETRTYTALATMIGEPKAVRAVASACAKNSIALLIPCHRVVRSDGTIGEYRWGIERKRELLNAERRNADKNGLPNAPLF